MLVQRSSLSEAETEVIVGVSAGEAGRCIAYSDDSTAGVEYIGGSDGFL